MRTRTRRTLAAGLALALVVTLAGCRISAPTDTRTASLRIPCGSSGTQVNARWTFPTDRDPVGLIWLQHGFARSAARVDDVARSLAARGHVVVAPDLGSFGSCTINEEATHTAIAALLSGGSATAALQTSWDAARSAAGAPTLPLPAKVVVSGHSAGGALATVVGGKLASDPSATVRARLAGVVLLDPVENSSNGMLAALPALAGTQVLTVSAPGGSCNSNASGTARLIAARSGFVGVRLPSGCHCDAEADTTDFLCTLTCGTPQTANETALKRLAGDWADDMLRGRRVDENPYPGGTWYQEQLQAGTLVTLTGAG
jgi:hypothetical protein